VTNVSWRDAQAFVQWLGQVTGAPYRLPSEAEWEYACRAGTTTHYSFGDTITSGDANYSEGKPYGTTEVGTYPYQPNPWGLYDMHGNVCEWVQDVRHDSYKGAPTNGSVWDSDGDSSRRVYRGGSCRSSPWGLRSADRNGCDPDFRSDAIGFCVARTLD
jgi:formylglycine-generating enzyme required for sulfatase activity